SVGLAKRRFESEREIARARPSVFPDDPDAFGQELDFEQTQKRAFREASRRASGWMQDDRGFRVGRLGPRFRSDARASHEQGHETLLLPRSSHGPCLHRSASIRRVEFGKRSWYCTQASWAPCRSPALALASMSRR